MVRPKSITIVAWMVIVTSAVNVLTMLFVAIYPPAREILYQTIRGPIPISVQLRFGFLGLIISFVCGIFMLKGTNWARVIYLSWGAIGFLVGIVNLGSIQRMLPGGAIFAVTAFFLTRKTANAFFTEYARH